MRPEITHQLKITLVEKTSELLLDLKEELHKLNIFSYSEDSIDDLDSIDNEECEKRKEELFDDSYLCDSITLHAYEKESLVQCKEILEKVFQKKVLLVFSEMTTSSWLDGWRDSFKPIETERYLVCPPWDRDLKTIKKEIIIEPALAFGTGQHETTQICLRLLESYLKDKSETKDLSVLDFGTGSGILAVAAAKEGLQKIEAIDIDEDSVAATKTNADLNNVSFKAYKYDLKDFLKEEGPRNYDLILANILLPVLRSNLSVMASITKSHSELILSGLILEQKEEMLEICQQNNFVLVEEIVKGDWLGLRVRKK